jgi:hypothetical protein
MRITVRVVLLAKKRKAGVRMSNKTASERFWAKVIKQSSGCWEWIGCLTSNGYGLFWDGEGKIRAHRFAYEEVKGIIPDGLEIDHLCRNKICVNPNHLEVVTRTENIKRGILPGILRTRKLSRDCCLRGHPYNLFNTHIRPDGSRECRACRKIYKDKSRFTGGQKK